MTIACWTMPRIPATRIATIGIPATAIPATGIAIRIMTAIPAAVDHVAVVVVDVADRVRKNVRAVMHPLTSRTTILISRPMMKRTMMIAHAVAVDRHAMRIVTTMIVAVVAVRVGVLAVVEMTRIARARVATNQSTAIFRLGWTRSTASSTRTSRVVIRATGAGVARNIRP